MTQQEITKLRVINQTIDKTITIREAAELLDLSERQVIRLKGGVINQGPAFIIHKNRGRKPVHTISNNQQEKIVKLKKTRYQEANFAHFKDLLEEHEGICVSYPTVYRILTRAGITSPKKQRKRKAHHRRKRKPQEGMMVQIDASPHIWIVGKTAFSLHGSIDDATGKITALFFTENECLEGYFQIMRYMLIEYGAPMSVYCDRHTIFVSPKEGKLSIDEQLKGKQVNLTQFGRAMKELGINIIKAKSAQGKGRIERLWGTLQSRLPVEFKVRGINTLEEANAFLSEFMNRYNKKFAVKPEKPESAFRKLDKNIDLETILCIKKERTIINGGAISYQGKYYQLMKKQKHAPLLSKTKITVLDSSKTGIRGLYNGEVYDTIVLEERPKNEPILKEKSKTKKERSTVVPVDHPWRKAQQKPKPIYEETDSEILKMLDELFSSTRAWA